MENSLPSPSDMKDQAPSVSKTEQKLSKSTTDVVVNPPSPSDIGYGFIN